MSEKINEKISVIMVSSARKRTAAPYLICWQNREYKIGKIGYHHKIYEGRVLHHIFEVTDSEQTLWFRLNMNTDTLQWILEVVSDGSPS